jgi:hypothetical protein
MLLEIRADTSRCEIFRSLNEEIGYFIESCVTAKRFGKGLFSKKLGDAIYGNDPTKDKFHKLWMDIRPLAKNDRENLLNQFKACQFVQHYYEDIGFLMPVFPAHIDKRLEELTKHLFSNSTKLVEIKIACGETLHQHFDRFRAVNSNVCCFCGASELAQFRVGVDVEHQWRPDNDHLLSKDSYAVFAVHPENLIPLCDTCNKKAKLSKNLLVKKKHKKNDPDQRRLSFFPFVEFCQKHVGIEVIEADLKLMAKFSMNPPSVDIEEKLNTWNDVYRMQERVEGKFVDLVVLAENDCPANNLNEFRQKIQQKADTCKNNCRLESWNFWSYRLYEWLHNNGGSIVEALWNSILDKRSDDDAANVYGL